jgi:hypothetical protein
MKHIQLFEQFINEAKAEVKLGRVTPKNIDEKAQQVLEVLQDAVGKTINGEELKKMVGRNWGGPGASKGLKNAKIEIIAVHVGHNNSYISMQFVYKTDSDLFDNHAEGNQKLKDLEDWTKQAHEMRPMRAIDGSNKEYKSDASHQVKELVFNSLSPKNLENALSILKLGDIIL